MWEAGIDEDFEQSEGWIETILLCSIFDTGFYSWSSMTSVGSCNKASCSNGAYKYEKLINVWPNLLACEASSPFLWPKVAASILKPYSTISRSAIPADILKASLKSMKMETLKTEICTKECCKTQQLGHCHERIFSASNQGKESVYL